MPPQLTERREDILRATLRLTARYGRAPTPSELAAELDVSRQAMRVHLQAMRDLGLLETREDRVRQHRVVLTGEGERAAGRAGGFPVVGQIAAGQPAFAEQSVEGYAVTLGDVLDLRPGDFLLTVRGDSMMLEGIRDGDTVAIRPASECHNGEIAAVLLPNENVATLKRFYRDIETVTLVSENPDFAPMTFGAGEVRVQGCLVGHIAKPRPRKARREN